MEVRVSEAAEQIPVIFRHLHRKKKAAAFDEF
jgi:hypothetical protein